MIPLAILASIACHHVSIRRCEVYGRFAGREPLINPLVLGFVNGWRICFGLFFGGAFFFWPVGRGLGGVHGGAGAAGSSRGVGAGGGGPFFWVCAFVANGPNITARARTSFWGSRV